MCAFLFSRRRRLLQAQHRNGQPAGVRRILQRSRVTGNVDVGHGVPIVAVAVALKYLNCSQQ